jgi:hypothetical protein
MNHEAAREHLHDAVDGLLSAQQAADLDAHLGACAECRNERARIEALRRAAAALPRELPPARDLWPAIAARTVDAPITPAAAAAGSEPVHAPAREVFAWSRTYRAWRAMWPVFAGTAAVLAIVIATTLQRSTARPSGVEAMATATANALEAECSQPERERIATQAAAASPAVSTPALNVIADNLRIVERAIAEARRAWEANPTSPRLMRMLAAAYKAKAALEDRATEIAARSG